MINDNEKKYIYLIFLIAAVILIITLGIIWVPMFKNGNKDKTIISANYYKDDYYVDRMKEEYKKVVIDAVNIENFDQIKEKINKQYLESINENESSIKEYLVKNKILTHPSSSMTVYNTIVRNDGKKYVYSYKYKIGNEEKMIHIIEDYYKNYTISYDQEGYPILDNNTYEMKDSNGMVYKIKYYKSYENTLILELIIENNTTEEFVYNFGDSVDSDLIFNGDNKRYLTNIVVGNGTSMIKSEPGSTNKVYLTYEIEIKNQQAIQAIEFNNILRMNTNIDMVKLDIK